MSVTCDCENCFNYIYDEEYDSYECQIHLDEDDMIRFLRNEKFSCPHFQFINEYKIVNKQI